ncbi:MAG: hypothetical protein ACYCOU_00120 [Sulfobacillus sp.]
MCGSDSNIRIEKVGNGYVVDAYEAGGRGKNGEHREGKHHRHIATSPAHVIRLLGKHLGRAKGVEGPMLGKGRGKKFLGKRAKAKTMAKRA